MGGFDVDNGNDIAVDGSGNIITVGIFTGTADFDPGAGTVNLLSAGELDVFITKHDNAGNLLWSKSIGGSLSDFAYSVGLDPT